MKHTILWFLPLIFLFQSCCDCPNTFTLVAYVDASSNPDHTFEFSTTGTSGTIRIDWGDGNSNGYTLAPSPIAVHTHTYTTSGNFLVLVTGDLERITSFYSFYGNGMIDAINIKHLYNLEEIRLGMTRGPALIDLSYNKKLKTVVMPNIQQLDSLILPTEHFINYIDISGPSNLSAASVDDVIDKVYQVAVQQNIINGYFRLSEHLNQPVGPPIGPPSSASVTKLSELRNTYSWQITP